MTPTSKTLIFFGNEQLASGVSTDAPVFRSLIDAGYDIAFLAIKQAEGSGRKSKTPKIVEVAQEHGIEIMTISSIPDLSQAISQSGASFGVLAAFGRIVPQEIIDLFEHGIINIHPSLLPEFRGSTPIESAILSGQSKTGVSLMKLSAGMDEGQILGFAELDNIAGMPKQNLYEELAEVSSALLIELLPGILDGTITPMEQDHDHATYTKQISKQDGSIDWTKPAEQIEREIRAYAGWPGSQTSLAGKDVTIIEVKIIDASGKPGEPFMINKSSFGVYCGEGALEITKLKPAGKSEMSSAAFLAGNKLN